MIEQIKKRDGRVVVFNSEKIERAIEKAFIATSTAYDSSLTELITDDVVVELEKKFTESTPGVEDVQDAVEEKLGERGFFNVAKAYIIYRRDHAKLRDKKKEEILEKIKKSDLHVKKRDGSIAPFDINEIEKAVINCCRGFKETIDFETIINGCKHNIYDGIGTKDINQAVLMAIKSKLEEDPVYSFLAARFLFNDLYKEVLGVDEFEDGFLDSYKKTFPEQIKKGIEAGRLDKRLLSFDLLKLSEYLQPENDRLFAYMGAQILYDRYFLQDAENNILEAPQHFWMRVAMGIALNESEKEEWAVKFYKIISQILYVPSTPTLLHSGLAKPQMSSCYLTTVEDDLSHIFKSITDNAQLSRWSGGIANDWTNIRGTSALIKTINVPSQGVIPFLKIVDSTTAAINRSGKRRGATCVYLETWHYDIEEFLDLRKNTGDDRRRTHDTNTANWVPDLFMERVMADRHWTLFSPDETPDLHHLYGKKFKDRYEEYEWMAEEGKIKLFKRIRAKDLWRKMVTMLYETGHPWVTFKDPCNIRSPQDHCGVVHSSNLCTEITLNTSAQETAVCNLGSINLPRHIKGASLDRDLLKETVVMAMRMLDNVIDINFYPTREAENSNLKHRPIGLGIMGLQDVFYELDLKFDGDKAVEFSDEVMEFISYHAILASSILAKEKGAYSSYKGSKWDRGIFPIDTIKILEKERGLATEVEPNSKLDWSEVRESVRNYGMRNSNCMAIAPTATIANISGCLPSIEPIYKNLYVKSNFSGEFTVINKHLIEDLKAIGLWSKDTLEKIKYHDGSIQKIDEIPHHLKEKYKEAFEIDPYWFIKHAAQRGKWIDQSQSLNIFTASKSGSLISESYFTAWKMGLKTTYYLRTLGASSVEKATLDINKNYEPEKEKQPMSVGPSFANLPAGKAGASEGQHIHVSDDGICESCQ